MISAQTRSAFVARAVVSKKGGRREAPAFFVSVFLFARVRTYLRHQIYLMTLIYLVT
jgi:hypothetical protein